MNTPSIGEILNGSYELLSTALRACAKVIKYGATVQNSKRLKFVKELNKICSDIEEAFSKVLTRLEYILQVDKNQPELFSKAVSDFIEDEKLRAAFKPQQLCGRISELALSLASWLDGLRYSLDAAKLTEISELIKNMNYLDNNINESYNMLLIDLRKICFEINNAVKKKEKKEAMQAGWQRIQKFQINLSDMVSDAHDIKMKIIYK